MGFRSDDSPKNTGRDRNGPITFNPKVLLLAMLRVDHMFYVHPLDAMVLKTINPLLRKGLLRPPPTVSLI